VLFTGKFIKITQMALSHEQDIIARLREAREAASAATLAIATTESRFSEFVSLFDMIKNEGDGKKTEIDEYKERIASLTAKLSETQSERDTLKNEVASLQAKCAKYRKEIQGTHGRMSEHAKTLATLMSTIQSLQAGVIDAVASEALLSQQTPMDFDENDVIPHENASNNENKKLDDSVSSLNKSVIQSPGLVPEISPEKKLEKDVVVVEDDSATETRQKRVNENRSERVTRKRSRNGIGIDNTPVTNGIELSTRKSSQKEKDDFQLLPPAAMATFAENLAFDDEEAKAAAVWGGSESESNLDKSMQAKEPMATRNNLGSLSQPQFSTSNNYSFAQETDQRSKSQQSRQRNNFKSPSNGVSSAAELRISALEKTADITNELNTSAISNGANSANQIFTSFTNALNSRNEWALLNWNSYLNLGGEYIFTRSTKNLKGRIDGECLVIMPQDNSPIIIGRTSEGMQNNNKISRSHLHLQKVHKGRGVSIEVTHVSMRTENAFDNVSPNQCVYLQMGVNPVHILSPDSLREYESGTYDSPISHTLNKGSPPMALGDGDTLVLLVDKTATKWTPIPGFEFVAIDLRVLRSL
jgi:FtsZ-binding cell division protein ZapB